MKLSKIQMWNLLTQEQRQDIRNRYKVPASGSKEVVDNRVVRDGVQEGDLEVLDRRVLLDALNIKEENYVETDKTKNLEQADEESVQYSDGGGSAKDTTVKKPSVSEQAGNRPGKIKNNAGGGKGNKR